MILGSVNSDREITFPVTIRDLQNNEFQLEAILDTGFDGSLILPPTMISHLGLPWQSSVTATLADGNTGRFDIHSATILWDGVPRLVSVGAVDTTPLIGMALLANFDLQVRIVPGGVAKLTAVP